MMKRSHKLRWITGLGWLAGLGLAASFVGALWFWQRMAASLPQLQGRIEAAGLEFEPPRPRVSGEGRSLYFYDDDNHLFELHTGTLRERLDRYAHSASEEHEARM